MGKPTTTEGIVAWADTQAKKTAPTDSYSYKRLTDADRILILKLHDQGLTQVEIAQRLDRAQSTISDIIRLFADTTTTAKRYLAAQALRMAENVVETGQARDHIAALKGLKVLAEDASQTQIAIGISLPGLTFASKSSTDSEDLHSVNGDLGSDNGGYVATIAR